MRIPNFLLLSAALFCVVRADEGVVKYQPLSIGALSEVGMLQGGRFSSQTKPFRDEWVDHFAAYLTQSASVDEKWFLNVGIGGVFEFQKPEDINAQWGGTQYRNFFVGPTTADVEYEVLKNSTQSWKVGMGLFGYKYNADASNLGEYLFRSGPYPTYITTGAYTFVNNSAASLQGLKSNFTRGNFSADVFLLTETTMPPLYDISLAGVVRYNVADGLLNLGAGVNFKRLVPIEPSKTTVKNPNNAYFTGPDGKEYIGNQAYYRNQKEFYGIKIAAAGATAADTAHYQEFKAQLDSVTAWETPGSAFKPDYSYYTQSGIVLEANASLDPKKWLSPETRALFGPNDLRVYTEAAVLGVQNYPVFYKSVSDRMPIMAGINLPGFKFIDLISLQFEYFNSPNINSFYESVSSNGAVPQFVEGTQKLLSHDQYADQLSNDNYSWSLLVKKQLTRGLTFSFQAARDHTRMVSKDTYAGPFLDPNEVFYKSGGDNWYWMTQFSFGI